MVDDATREAVRAAARVEVVKDLPPAEIVGMLEAMIHPWSRVGWERPDDFTGRVTIDGRMMKVDALTGPDQIGPRGVRVTVESALRARYCVTFNSITPLIVIVRFIAEVA